jgi:hypothetical protein
MFFAYLFPPLDPADRLPLLTRGFVDPDAVNRDTPDTHYIRVRASVRTTEEAQALLDEHREKELRRIAYIASRKRRRGGRIRRAVRRLAQLWR